MHLVCRHPEGRTIDRKSPIHVFTGGGGCWCLVVLCCFLFLFFFRASLLVSTTWRVCSACLLAQRQLFQARVWVPHSLPCLRFCPLPLLVFEYQV